MTSQKLTEGLNEPTNMLITFMVSLWKITGFQGVGKTFLSNELGQYFDKIKCYKQNNYVFSLSDSSKKLEILRFPVSLSNELGKLSHGYKNLKNFLRP